MKVKLLKPWLKAPTRKPGAVFELNKEAAEYGINRGLCEPAEGAGSTPADPEKLRAELKAARQELADTQLLVEDKAERIGELEKQLGTAEQAVTDLTSQVNALENELAELRAQRAAPLQTNGNPAGDTTAAEKAPAKVKTNSKGK